MQPLIKVISENATAITAILSCLSLAGVILVKTRAKYSLFKDALAQLLSLPGAFEQHKEDHQRELSDLKSTIGSIASEVQAVKDEVRDSNDTSFRREIIEKLNTIGEYGRTTRNYLDIPLYETDPDGLCTYASPALCRLFGLPQEEMLGTGWLRAITSDDGREKAWYDWTKAIEIHIPYKTTYRIKGEAGKDIEVTVTASKVVGANGEIIKFIGHVTNTEIIQPPRRRAPRKKVVGNDAST